MSSLRVQLPWQRNGATSRRHSRVNASIFDQQQMEESVEDEDEDPQLRLEVPRLGDGPQMGDQRRDQAARGGRGGGGGERGEGGEGGRGGRARGGGPPREGDLDVMSATSWALGHVRPSASTSSQHDRRAQIDSCWCNIPDMFIDPASRAAYYWMALVTVAVIYNWIVVILRVAFEDMRDSEFHQGVFRVMDTISDVIYFMDVAIQSRTAYLEDGCLVKSLPETVLHYRSQAYFVLDVLAVVPLSTLLSHLAKIGLPCPFESGFSSLTTPSLRIMCLLKYPSMTRFFEKTDSRTNNPNLLRAFRLSLHLWLVIHWIGCFYYLLSQYEGLGTNDWVYPNTTEFATFSRKYIFSMYWSTMTLTTIGERPWPVTDVEYVFTGVTFLIGVFVFAAVVGNVGDVISNMNAARHDFQARMDQIKFYLNHRNVPEHLQDQIKRWAEYTWARTKAINEQSVLQLLPSRLRTEVAIHVHLKTLKKVRLFDQCEEGLLRELVLKLRPSIYSPGEYICRIGEIGREMYIIDHGKVEILFPEHGSGQMKQVAIMMPGNYFGEISLLKLDEGQNKRTADVRSVGFSELLCLSRRDLMSALMEYPEAKKILEAQARQRMEHTSTKRPGESDADESVSSLPKSERRSARAIFAQVMRQEGFSKLLASTANEELAEMKKILKELKEIKSQLAKHRATQEKLQVRDSKEQQQQRDQDLHWIQNQLLMHADSLVTSPSLSSAPGSTVTTLTDLSSGTSTLTSPSAAQCALLTPPTHPRQAVSGTKPTCSLECPVQLPSQHASSSSACEAGLPSAMPKKQSKHSAKDGSSFGSSLPQNLPVPLPVLPASPPPVKARRRRSPSGRTPKSTGKPPVVSKDAETKGVRNKSAASEVVQGGGGDEPVVAAVEKDPPVKDLGDGGKGLVPAKKSASITNASSSEFVTLSSARSQEKQPGLKPAVLRASSEQLLLLAQSDSIKSLSSETSSVTDTSSTTSSSGGRGHSPKPAKPRPRYNLKPRHDSHGHATSPDSNSRRLEETVHGESHGDDRIDPKRGADTHAEGYVSSEGFSVASICSSLDSADSAKSPTIKAPSYSSGERKCLPEKCTVTKPGDFPLQMDTSIKKSEGCEQNMKSSDSSEVGRENLISGSCADALKSTQDVCSSPQIEGSTKTQLSPGKEKELTDELCDGSVLCNQEEKESTVAKIVDMFEKTVISSATDNDEQEDVEVSEDSDTNSEVTFIPATRVRSDFDKSISSSDLKDLPQAITCQKIDDGQLSVLLAKRRAVNDSPDNSVEGPGQSKLTEHSHSVQAVITKNLGTSFADRSAQSVHKDATPYSRKQTTDGTAEHAQKSLPTGEDKLFSELEDSESRSCQVQDECSDLPVVAAGLPSKFQDVVDNGAVNPGAIKMDENKPGMNGVDGSKPAVSETDDSDSSVLERKEFESVPCASRDSHSESMEDFGIPSKNVQSKDESDDSTGTDCSAMAALPQMQTGAKEKTYPVSILKKHRPETQSESQPDFPKTEKAECSDAGDISATDESDTDTLAKTAMELLSKRADDNKDPVAEDSESGPQPADSKKYSNIVRRKTRTRKVSLHLRHDLSSQDSETPPESVTIIGPVNVSACDRDLLSGDLSTEAVAPESASESDNETVASHQHSASWYPWQCLGRREESTDPASPSGDPESSSDAGSLVGSARFAAVSDGHPSTRRHSEKLDSLIATFDKSMKKHESEDLRDGAEKNTVVSHAEADSISHSQLHTASKESKQERKEKASDSVGDTTSRVAPSDLIQNDIKSEDEAKTDYSSSLTTSPPTSPHQKRKTLRRRNVMKHVSSSKERAEDSYQVETNEGIPEDSSDTVWVAPDSVNKEKNVVKAEEPQMPTEDMIAGVSLANNLSWKMDTDTNTSPVGNISEPPLSASAKEIPETVTSVPGSKTEEKGAMKAQKPQMRAEDTTICLSLVKNLVWETDIDNKASSACDISSTRSRLSSQEEENWSSTSKLEARSGRNLCAERMLESSQGEDLDSIFSGNPKITNARKQIASLSKNLSFKDKIREAAETLDKANNSATHSLSSSGGSSPLDCMITSSAYASQPHMTDCLPAETPIMENIWFEAPCSTNYCPLNLVYDITPVPSSTQVEDESPEGHRSWTSDTSARQENRLGSDAELGGPINKQRNNTTSTQHHNAGGDTLDPPNVPQTGSLLHTHALHPSQASEAGNRMPDPQNPTDPRETQQQQNEQSDGRDRETEAMPPQLMTESIAESQAGSDTVEQAFPALHPSLLDSPGASSVDDSAEDEGERAVEAMTSLILLADFGVEDEDDDEGALSGLSCGEDHSDLNSDLDDM